MNTYRDSISGLDIELHPTGEQILFLILVFQQLIFQFV
ncbi:MAG6090-like repeat-containing lipoprotein, partial [Mycoplasmopsis bovis]